MTSSSQNSTIYVNKTSIDQDNLVNESRIHRYDTDHIRLSQSPPPDRRPRFFQSKGLAHLPSDSDSPDEDNYLNDHDLQEAAIRSEAEHFSHIIAARKQQISLDFANDCSEDQDIISQAIIARLELALEMTKSMKSNDDEHISTNDFDHDDIVTSSNASVFDRYRPYPPIERVGIIHDHDRPFAEYGHLDASEISQSENFDLAGVENEHRRKINKKRMDGTTWAITCWSEVPKYIVLDEIRRQFTDQRLQYVCVSSEQDSKKNKTHLHIQVITKESVNKKSWFLDEITRVHCNYQVTNNDRAWNEYCKKGGDFIEFGEFKSSSKKGSQQWPELPLRPLSISSQASSSNDVHNQLRSRSSVRHTTEERRQRKIVTAKRALILAETNVNKAMDLVRESMPMEFMAHSSWYLSTFNYVRLQAQRKQIENFDSSSKKHSWPSSFPDCTPALREGMNRWIRHHFSRKSRAKCLVLIGPTGTGKTTFALSLPGVTNYFKGRWNLDSWNPTARYSVYDDIGWDNFEKMNYPSKKDLLTQNGLAGATDKYRHSTMINVIQPAIVLLNPGRDEGSLTDKPQTKDAEEEAKYWQKRAFIYRMQPGEYFYKRQQQGNTNSSNSSMNSDEERIGHPNEFNMT